MIGLGISIGLKSTSFSSSEIAASVDSYFFELSGSDIQPKDSITDNNSIWDLDGDSNITPASSPTDEGYFQTDGNGDIQPTS